MRVGTESILTIVFWNNSEWHVALHTDLFSVSISASYFNNDDVDDIANIDNIDNIDDVDDVDDIDNLIGYNTERMDFVGSQNINLSKARALHCSKVHNATFPPGMSSRWHNMAVVENLKCMFKHLAVYFNALHISQR